MPTQIQLEQLAKSLEGSLLFDELHKTIYSTDASVYKMCPIAVAIPKTEQDIVILIQFAKNHKISLTPRTAGTYLAGQTVGKGIIVDVSKHFTKIISVDEKVFTMDYIRKLLKCKKTETFTAVNKNEFVNTQSNSTTMLLETEDAKRERLLSLKIVYFTMFLMSLGFSIILTGIWPYLDKVSELHQSNS